MASVPIRAGRIQGRQRRRQQVDDEAARAEHQKRSMGGDSGRNQMALFLARVTGLLRNLGQNYFGIRLWGVMGQISAER